MRRLQFDYSRGRVFLLDGIDRYEISLMRQSEKVSGAIMNRIYREPYIIDVIIYLCPKGERQRKSNRRPKVVNKTRKKIACCDIPKLRSLFKYHTPITIHSGK
jgi:hypothetical protein